MRSIVQMKSFVQMKSILQPTEWLRSAPRRGLAAAAATLTSTSHGAGSLNTHRVLIAAALATLAACKDLGPGSSVFYEHDIQAAVFEHQFKNNESSQQNNAQIIFIGKFANDWETHSYYVDLDEALMQQFVNHEPPVKRVSECTYSPAGVFDKVTGTRGLLFWIDSMSEINDGKVEVRGGYFEAGLSASGNVYTLEQTNGVWKVVKDVLLWIS